MSGRGRDWIRRVGMETFLKSRLLLWMSSSYCIKVVNKTLKGVHYSKKNCLGYICIHKFMNILERDIQVYGISISGIPGQKRKNTYMNILERDI